jgi:hypothetical protein
MIDRMKCKRPSDARAHHHHTLQVMRQQAVKAVRHGETADSVSKSMGVNIRTVFHWLADFSVGGQTGVRQFGAEILEKFHVFNKLSASWAVVVMARFGVLCIDLAA